MRSDFLVHWTGKKFASDPSTLRDTHRAEYVGRLASILADGFWMTIPKERIEGRNGAWIEYEAPMTCFTEIRLSQTLSHAKRYGLLGIGVSRQFVLDRFGGPVHYVRNHNDECIIGNAQKLFKALEDLDARKELEDLRDLDAAKLRKYLAVNCSFIKKMSDPNEDNFEYLNEQEWRIVHTYFQEEAGKLVPTGVAKPPYLIPVPLGDVRIVVFPDDQTRTKARSDDRLRAWFQDPPSSNPILLTLQECGYF